MAKILVTMPDDFLNKVDGLALTEQRSRSELIREALRTYMRRISAKQAKTAPKNAEILESLIG
ncbi:ribbon-helix-helix protein, CopG family [bacterium]|nr:ribbon-helix-helix protein, CopG family [bacterium]